MLIHRNLKASVRAWLENLFENPSEADQALGVPVYNVYGEAEMRIKDFTETTPFIYLVDSRTLVYESVRLPVLVLEMDTQVGSFLELGNRARGHYCEVVVSIYARNRAERDDLASFIEKNLDTIPIYDYSDDTPVLLETAAIEPGVGVSDVKVTGKIAAEASLMDWVIVSFSFATIN